MPNMSALPMLWPHNRKGLFGIGVGLCVQVGILYWVGFWIMVTIRSSSSAVMVIFVSKHSNRLDLDVEEKSRSRGCRIFVMGNAYR